MTTLGIQKTLYPKTPAHFTQPQWVPAINCWGYEVLASHPGQRGEETFVVVSCYRNKAPS